MTTQLSIVFATMVMLGIALLAMAFVFKQVALAFVAGFTFISLSIVGWSNSTATYDLYWLIALVGLILLFTSFVMGYLIQAKTTDEGNRQEYQDYLEDKERNPEKYMDEQERYSRHLDRMIESAHTVANTAAARRSLNRTRRRINQQ